MLTTQLGVISNLDEGALNPTAHVADNDVKQHWSLDPEKCHSSLVSTWTSSR